MSGRIRTIKPEILEDETTAGLSDGAWRLWVSMWVMADDEGRLRASAQFLMSKAFWNHPTSTPIDTLLDELVTAGRVTVYVVRGERYVEIRNWKKHQKIDRPQPAKHPSPDESFDDHSTNVRRTLADHSTIIRDGREGKGREGRGMEGMFVASPAAPPAPPAPKSKGTRLSSDWTPSEKTVETFRQQAVNALASLDRFRDYWLAQSGSRGVKADWEATFRNWVREDIARGRAETYYAPSQTRMKTAPPSEPATPEQLAMAERLLSEIADARRIS